MQHIHGFSPPRETSIFSLLVRPATTKQLHSNKSASCSVSDGTVRKDSLNKSQSLSLQTNLKRLTSRIVVLTRRRQLHQIFEEIEIAKRRYGKLNTIVMNAVMEACVHCGDIDSALQIFEEMSKPESCGVDSVTFGTLLKGLGEARRIDEAFQLLESVEQDTAIGSPKLSPALIYGLLNALIEAGDVRRANGLVARYRFLLHGGSGPSILMYNLLMKGYIKMGFPQDALTLHDEILCRGLKPDQLTYNTLASACVKAGNLEFAMRLFAEMKDEAQKAERHDLYPDVVTYTTLLKGFGQAMDLLSVQKIVLEMKSSHGLFIDRIAYTAMIDAFLNCCSVKDSGGASVDSGANAMDSAGVWVDSNPTGALCLFGEVLKLSGQNSDLRPKPHLYISMMRTFAFLGDYDMVKNLHMRMWLDTVGTIAPPVQVEADELLMEAALNNGQVDAARQILLNIITRWKRISWTSRGSMVAVRIEALSGFSLSTLHPYLLHQVSLSDPVENIMTPFAEAQPLHATLDLKKVVMRFFSAAVVPVIDDWGSCIGLVHREDCNELNAPLSNMMKAPPCITTSMSIGRAIDLLLQKRYKMIIVVKSSDLYGTSYGPNLRAVGVLTSEQLSKLTTPAWGQDNARAS